jgi:hypothetical protein
MESRRVKSSIRKLLSLKERLQNVSYLTPSVWLTISYSIYAYALNGFHLNLIIM